MAAAGGGIWALWLRGLAWGRAAARCAGSGAGRASLLLRSAGKRGARPLPAPSPAQAALGGGAWARSAVTWVPPAGGEGAWVLWRSFVST